MSENEEEHNTVELKTKTVDFRNMKATEMRTNQRFKIIEPFENKLEKKRENLKV